MRYRWANPISPRAAIRRSRRGKRRTAELLRVEAERMLLGRVLAQRQPTRNSLSRKFVSKSALIPDLIGHASHLSQAVLHGAMFGFVHRLVYLVETADGK
jgi:hypothetical protein